MWCMCADDAMTTVVHSLDPAAGARSAGRLYGDGRQHRPRDRHAGRVFLSGLGVQPRHAGAAPAGFVVQAVCLCRGAGQRLFARDDRGRRPDRDQHAAGAVAAANSSNQFYGPTPLRTGIEQSRNLMTIRLAQEVGMERWRAMPNALASMTRWAGSGQRAGLAGNHAVPDGRGLCDVRQWRRAGGTDAGRPRAGPLWQDRLSPRRAHLRRLQMSQPCRRSAPAHQFQPRAGDGRDHRLSADLDDARRGRTRHGAQTVNLPVPTQARPAPPTTPRTCGSSALPPISSRAATSAMTSRVAGARRVWRRHVRAGVPAVHDASDQEIRRRQFRSAAGWQFIKIDRFTGARLPMTRRATTWWPNVSATAKSRSLASRLMVALPWGRSAAVRRGRRATGVR